MPWLLIYVSVAFVVLAVLSLFFARAVRGDLLRLMALIAAAVLWPVMLVGIVQYGAIRGYAAYLGRHSGTRIPVAVETEPATMPVELVDSLARFTQRIGATRPA